MSVAEKLLQIKKQLPENVRLIAVSKTYPPEAIMKAYETGHRIFGENKVQELCEKHNQLPKDIEWHLIGHLQTNKVKYVASFVHLIHSVDSLKLLKEINKQALKNNRIIPCLIQLFIAKEETKFGLTREECLELLKSPELSDLKNIRLVGLMGMASNTENQQQIENEFASLFEFFTMLKNTFHTNQVNFSELSMGMSSDYKLAINQGATLIRIGSTIFGSRNYNNLV